MKDLEGKVALVTGITNKRSIAYAVAEDLGSWGARLVLTHFPLGREGELEKFNQTTAALKPELVLPLDVTDPASAPAMMAEIGKQLGGLDVLVHAIASAKREELDGRFSDTSPQGFQLALQVSAYSLIELVRTARPLMEGRPASVITLTYIGSERATKNYNVMGSAKAALEASVRYLAFELGPEGIRVNAVSPGPIRTVSASGIRDFLNLLKNGRDYAALKRNITQQEVAHAVSFLGSELASGITGQVVFVDGGFNAYG